MRYKFNIHPRTHDFRSSRRNHNSSKTRHTTLGKMKSLGLFGILFAVLQLTSISAHPLTQGSVLLDTKATGSMDAAGAQSTPLQNVTLHFMKRPGGGADGAADGAAEGAGEAGESGESGEDGEDGESGESGDGPFDDISDWFHDLDPPKPGPGEVSYNVLDHSSF